MNKEKMNKIFKIYKNNPKLNVSFADFPQTENRFMENASEFFIFFNKKIFL